MAVVAPGVPHEFPPQEGSDRLILTGVVGSSFLKKHFGAFSAADFHSAIIDLATPAARDLKSALDSAAAQLPEKDARSSLLVMGELYKICAYLLDVSKPKSSETVSADAELAALESIDGALELIYYEYKRPITVDDAAAITGYGKSNFCKIFKKNTGMTFHEALNKRRISLACGLLSETGLSVSEISDEVGFSEAKSFCRVFKATEGVTPGAYRRKSRCGTD